MINTINVSNYRSLGADIRLHPGPLSVLIGPNGSGKSNILDVLSFVRDAITQGLPAAITHRGGINSVRRRSQGRPFDIHIELNLTLDEGSATYTFTITGDRQGEYRVKAEAAIITGRDAVYSFKRSGKKWQAPDGLAPRMDEQSLALTALGGTEHFKRLVDYLSGITVYSIFPDTLRAAQKFDSARPLKEHGENWVSILRDLIKDKSSKEELVVGLRKLTGDISDVQVASAAGHLIAQFKHESKANKKKQWFEATGQSDGTLRVAGLLTALLQRPGLPVIGIEEPELTVHPGVLPMLVDYLRQASELSQVLVTTHSPIFLDILDVDKDAIFVVNRKDGETAVKQVRDSQIEPVRQRLLQLGDLFVSGDLQQTLFDDSEDE